MCIRDSARSVAMHKPRLIIGKGQGGLIATGYGRPGCLENVLATRNVQPYELFSISEAWGNVAAIVIQEPRMSKKGIQLANLQQACPELFQEYPVPSRRILSWKDTMITHYNETKDFFYWTGVEVLPTFGAIPFLALLEDPPTLMLSLIHISEPTRPY